MQRHNLSRPSPWSAFYTDGPPTSSILRSWIGRVESIVPPAAEIYLQRTASPPAR
uniref:Uncharacterized protein n=1 Tax=Spironucleus salmonicida TaxID=348837 RepID=V6LVA7_9EUKA|eukprot:EST44724.1 Hypothetical protein SS50377_15437 [Spironucleus salmonicida]